MTRFAHAATLAAAVAGLSAADAAYAAPGVQVGDLSTVVVSLVLVVGVIFAAAFVAKRTPFGLNARGNGPLKVVAALSLGPKERLLLVEASGEQLLIAVSPAGVFNVGRAANLAPAAPVFRLGDAQ
ncbi:MAG TPA: flagellar biosynthetic protein FliO [Gammaproteobacteria bacterium]|nr:flagellar biosynthetic protein FliO [Gammaproteobacteria bacterium]